MTAPSDPLAARLRNLARLRDTTQHVGTGDCGRCPRPQETP